MSSTFQEVLNAAQALPETTEAEKRTKISRLYYALYTYACEFHDSLGSDGILLKGNVGAHKQLSQKLTNPTVTHPELQTASRSMGTKQQLAHELRVKADYHLDEDVVDKDLRDVKRYVRDGMAIPLIKQAAA
jgi:hypothetical protein